MHRPTFSALCATTLALLAACQDHPTRPVGPPSALVSDGRELYGGNPDFFILPPLLPDPSSDPNFEAGKFNPELLPDVVICLVNTSTEECATDQPAGLPIIYTSTSGPGSETVRVVPEDEHYIVNIHVPDLDQLVPGERYRIQVFVASTRLGFADFIPESSMSEVKSVTTNEVIGLLDKRTLPFKFRIEDAALCEGGDPCNSKTINLGEKDNTVVLEATGDRIDIPQQTFQQTITVTLTLCDGIDVDSPQFGNCLTVTADPALAQNLEPRATVSICSIVGDPAAGALSESQEGLLTLYRQDNGDIFALPHAEDFCGQPISSAPGNFFQRLARAFGHLFGPRPLHATTAVLNVGDAGDTETFSRFRLVLPGQMFPLDGTDGQSADPGSPVAIPPGVRVVDRDGTPVAGATVLFQIAAGGGLLNAGTVVPCGSDASLSCVMSNTDGIATTVSWILGSAGTNTVRASGVGIADPDDPGPFMPENLDEFGQPIPADQQATVTVGSGEVLFTATIVEPGPIFLATFTDDAVNAPPGTPEIGAWSLTNPAGTILVRAAVGNLGAKPVELDHNAPGVAGSVKLRGTTAGTPPTSGVYRASWRSLVHSTDACFNGIVLRDAAALIIASVEYRPGGALTYNSNTLNAPAGTWARDVSQLFEITVDLNQKLTSLSIDGAPVVSLQGVAFVQNAANIGQINMELGCVISEAPQTYAWDDIVVSRVSP